MPRKQRRRTWGSITTVSRGKHVLRWVENTQDGRKRRSRTFYGTYREADRFLAEKRMEAEDSSCKDIGYAYDVWWRPEVVRKVEKGTLKRSTLKGHDRVWNLHVAPRWKRTPLTKIMRYDVQEWLLTMSYADAKIAITILRGIIDSAVKFEAVDNNKLRGIAFEMPEKAFVRDKRVYSVEGAESMLSEIKGERFEAAFIVAAFGGARTGEALAVGRRDVEAKTVDGLDYAIVRISKQMESVGDSPVHDLKTVQSDRIAIVPPPYSHRFFEISEERRAAGSEWMNDRGDGMPMNRGTLAYVWREDGRIPFSNLRNSWRTFAQFEWRIPGDTLEILMGHVLPGVTGKHYLRPSDDDLLMSFADAYGAYLRTANRKNDAN